MLFAKDTLEISLSFHIFCVSSLSQFLRPFFNFSTPLVISWSFHLVVNLSFSLYIFFILVVFIPFSFQLFRFYLFFFAFLLFRTNKVRKRKKFHLENVPFVSKKFQLFSLFLFFSRSPLFSFPLAPHCLILCDFLEILS